MKKSSKIIIGVALVLIVGLVAVFSTSNFGGCVYNDFEDQATVKSVEYKDDIINSVILASTTNNDTKYNLTQWDLTSLKLSFPLSDFENKQTVFNVEGRAIEEGTCNPFIIGSISKHEE